MRAEAWEQSRYQQVQPLVAFLNRHKDGLMAALVQQTQQRPQPVPLDGTQPLNDQQASHARR